MSRIKELKDLPSKKVEIPEEMWGIYDTVDDVYIYENEDYEQVARYCAHYEQIERNILYRYCVRKIRKIDRL